LFNQICIVAANPKFHHANLQNPSYTYKITKKSLQISKFQIQTKRQSASLSLFPCIMSKTKYMQAGINFEFAMALYLMKPGNYKRQAEAWTTKCKITGVGKNLPFCITTTTLALEAQSTTPCTLNTVICTAGGKKVEALT
jgi:hypothetical protein